MVQYDAVSAVSAPSTSTYGEQHRVCKHGNRVAELPSEVNTLMGVLRSPVLKGTDPLAPPFVFSGRFREGGVGVGGQSCHWPGEVDRKNLLGGFSKWMRARASILPQTRSTRSWVAFDASAVWLQLPAAAIMSLRIEKEGGWG